MAYHLFIHGSNDLQSHTSDKHWKLAVWWLNAELNLDFPRCCKSLKLSLYSKYICDRLCNILHAPAGIQAPNLSILLQYTVQLLSTTVALPFNVDAPTPVLDSLLIRHCEHIPLAYLYVNNLNNGINNLTSSCSCDSKLR